MAKSKKLRRPVFFNGKGLLLSQGEINYLKIVFFKTNFEEPYLIFSDIFTLAVLPFSVALVVSVIYFERKRFRKEQQRVRYWDI